ncbi:hypothetical protein STEG23_019816 [Scotinomys teguina]
MIGFSGCEVARWGAGNCTFPVFHKKIENIRFMLPAVVDEVGTSDWFKHFFKEFIHFVLKDLYHIHKGCFKLISFCYETQYRKKEFGIERIDFWDQWHGSGVSALSMFISYTESVTSICYEVFP